MRQPFPARAPAISSPISTVCSTSPVPAATSLSHPAYTYFKQAFDRWTALAASRLATNRTITARRCKPQAGSWACEGTYASAERSSTDRVTRLPTPGCPIAATSSLMPAETSFYSNSSNNYRQLRNTIMHEVGHAFGLLHVESSTDALLMEPVINLGIDGRQLDDIRGIQGLYGDAFEKSNNGLGNGTAARPRTWVRSSWEARSRSAPTPSAASLSGRLRQTSSASPAPMTPTSFLHDTGTDAA